MCPSAQGGKWVTRFSSHYVGAGLASQCVLCPLDSRMLSTVTLPRHSRLDQLVMQLLENSLYDSEVGKVHRFVEAFSRPVV